MRSPAGTISTSRFGKGGLTSLDNTTRADAIRVSLDAADLVGELGATMILWPGVEGYNYPFQVPYAERTR